MWGTLYKYVDPRALRTCFVRGLLGHVLGAHDLLTFRSVWRVLPVKDIPDSATFREKDINTGLVRHSWEFRLFGPM